MKNILGIFICGILALTSCKKEKPEEVFGICGTDPNAMPVDTTLILPDTTLIPPENPDFGARVATITEADQNGNSFTRQLFYNAAGLVDSVVCTGSKSYAQRFTHTTNYTISRFYDGAGNATGIWDSVRLNAAGYPTAVYNIQQDTVWFVYLYNLNASGYLETTDFNQYKPGRYGRRLYTGWSNGDLTQQNNGCGNTRCSTEYGYDHTKPGMPGEPEQLALLLQMGRPAKHSAHLRISYKNAYDTGATPITYKWANRRIESWQSGTNPQVAQKRLTYYN